MVMPEFLDIDNWVRRQHFYFFKDYDNPYFNVCVNVDVTTLLELKRDVKDLSLFVTYHYLSTKTANEIESFRYRLREDKIIVHDVVHCGTITLLKNENFTFAYFDYEENFQRFHTNAKTILAEIHAGDGLLKPDERDDMIHHTVLPWFAFTSFAHARDAKQKSSVPKISFGKIFQEDDRFKMPLSVEVHHALMDGLHVGHYLERLENYLSNPREPLGL